jgi:hypothetical protein
MQLVLVALLEIFSMSLKDYCEQTSLHGWLYIFTAERRIWKAVWTLVMRCYYSEWPDAILLIPICFIV